MQVWVNAVANGSVALPLLLLEYAEVIQLFYVVGRALIQHAGQQASSFPLAYSTSQHLSTTK